MVSKQLGLFQHTPVPRFIALPMRLGQEIGAGIIGTDEVMGLLVGGFGAGDGGTTFHSE